MDILNEEIFLEAKQDEDIKGESKVCRLHFLDKKLEYHMGDGLLDWKITNTDVKEIEKLLNLPHDDFPQYTNWQMACWLWNLEYGFFSSTKNRDDYMSGKLDNEHKGHPLYVPSNLTIPETWTNEQSKGKKKKVG